MRTIFGAIRLVPVNPTPTTLGEMVTAPLSKVAWHVDNTDGSQSLQVYVEGKLAAASNYVPLPLSDTIPAGKGQIFEVDCSSLYAVRLRGIASGAGLTANVADSNLSQGY